jgi:hypothetical protein
MPEQLIGLHTLRRRQAMALRGEGPLGVRGPQRWRATSAGVAVARAVWIEALVGTPLYGIRRFVHRLCHFTILLTARGTPHHLDLGPSHGST